MISNQLTVLTENSAQRLEYVISQLSNEGIDIRAHCFVDNGDGNCKLRMIVSKPDKAVSILQDQRFAVVTNEVVVVEVEDRPGGLGQILSVLKTQKIRIDYSYIAVCGKPGIALMVFRFSDNACAARLLEESGLKAAICLGE